MESLRTVISRLFADTTDTNTPEPQLAEITTHQSCGFFSRKPPKRRRLLLLHPDTSEKAIDQWTMYDNSMIAFPFETTRIDYDALANDFLKACLVAGMAEQLKGIMIKYREPPITLSKATRLMTFLHHLIRISPITAKGTTAGATPPTFATTPSANLAPFPLGQLFEDLTLTLSLRPGLPQNPSALQNWVITLQFMLSCLCNSSPQALHNAGITTPVILVIIKHVLLELTRLPATNMSPLQKQCFLLGKQMLDLFLIRDPSSRVAGDDWDGLGSGMGLVRDPSLLPSTCIGTVTYYDVVYSFPELYAHFINATPSATAPVQPAIANHNVWLMTLHYMLTSITQDHKMMERIPTFMAVNIIKHVLREINTLPPSLSTAQINCLNKGKELINLLLLGPNGDGAGVVSHYDIIVALPDVYGHFLRGTFAQSIHWTMEKFINELGKRRRHLAFLMMPPDASWPLISQLSRRHEYNDLTTRTSYHMFEGDLIEFVKEGSSTSIETHFRDMLFQRATMDEFRQLVFSLTQAGLDTSQIRKAMVGKVRDVILCFQQHSRPGKRELSEKERMSLNQMSTQVRGEDPVMQIPSNMDLWELMIETADQLYSFVASRFFTYEDILRDFYELVHPPDNESHTPQSQSRLGRDNGLVWLLLQLFDIDKVVSNVIQKDFETDERLFEKMVALYNEEQINSLDAFSLRDLALQCAINHQKAIIKDITNLKHRYPSMASSLRYTGLCYQVQLYFQKHYHGNVAKDSTLFQGLDLQEMTKLALESQIRKSVMPNTLYVYLVPTTVETGTLGNPASTYARGGAIPYKLLDLLSVNAKHILLQLIYQMMLGDQGPKYHKTQSVCVSPNVIDVVYKLLCSAPCSAELMVKEIFDKVRRCDKLIKMKHTGEQGASAEALPVAMLRWLHTILQLMNYRFVRYLKYSSLSSGLFHNVRYSISYLDHRQVYQVLEAFVFNIASMQIDVKLLKSLDDPSREKPLWFAESETVARAVVTSISRLIKTRGQADIKTEQIHRVLGSLFEYRLEWSPESLKYFPPSVRSFYTDPQSPNQQIPLRPAISQQKIKQLVTATKTYTGYILKGSLEQERNMIQYFSVPENQPSLLCIIWIIAVMRMSLDGFHMASIRKLLLLITPAQMDTYTVDFVDFILNAEHPPMRQELPFKLLDTMIWEYQWINFTHVISALTKGGGSAERTARAFQFIQYLFFESPEFSKRVDKWLSLGFSPRFWTEENFNERLLEYLKEYPEYYEFDSFERNKDALDPPLKPQMPIYFANVVSNFIPFMEVIISRMIENSQKDLLRAFLDRYGRLFHYHSSPLSCVCNLFLYYYGNDVISDPPICKRILRLLDFDQYDIAPEAVAYAKDDNMDGTGFDASYFERVIHKLTSSLNTKKCAPRTKPNLPERHFREIGSPAVEGISIATLEVIFTPVPPATITKYFLDLVLQRGSEQTGVSSLTIHAIGLLLASLPPNEFVRPVWEDLNSLIMTNPYLVEVSEPCRLIRCGIPKRANGKFVMSQSLPDLTTASVLKDTMSARLRRAMVYPYTYNDYTFNLHNYSTNVPNCFMTLFHSILHYSSLDVFPMLLEYLRTMRQSGNLTTDVQVLYVCFLIGPALHRIEKLDDNSTDAEFLTELMHMVKQVTTLMDMKDGWSTQALEQVFDFLHHIRGGFVKSPDLTNQLREIIKSMNPPISQRLIRLVM